jgi:hypothetical protein
VVSKVTKIETPDLNWNAEEIAKWAKQITDTVNALAEQVERLEERIETVDGKMFQVLGADWPETPPPAQQGYWCENWRPINLSIGGRYIDFEIRYTIGLQCYHIKDVRWRESEEPAQQEGHWECCQCGDRPEHPAPRREDRMLYLCGLCAVGGVTAKVNWIPAQPETPKLYWAMCSKCMTGYQTDARDTYCKDCGMVLESCEVITEQPETPEGEGRWATLRRKLEHWANTDEPGSESQTSVEFVLHIMDTIEQADSTPKG